MNKESMCFSSHPSYSSMLQGFCGGAGFAADLPPTSPSSPPNINMNICFRSPPPLVLLCCLYCIELTMVSVVSIGVSRRAEGRVSRRVGVTAKRRASFFFLFLSSSLSAFVPLGAVRVRRCSCSALVSSSRVANADVKKKKNKIKKIASVADAASLCVQD